MKDIHPSAELRMESRPAHPKEGYRIAGGKDRIILSAPKAVGVLYGAYHLLRLQATGAPLSGLDIGETPGYTT